MSTRIIRSYTSADVAAGAIATSANRIIGREAYTYRHAIQKAAELGFPYHANKYGTSCYAGEQAQRIREELVKDGTKPAEEQPAPSGLSSYAPAVLVAELRRRGYDVTATRTIQESL